MRARLRRRVARVLAGELEEVERPFGGRIGALVEGEEGGERLERRRAVLMRTKRLLLPLKLPLPENVGAHVPADRVPERLEGWRTNLELVAVLAADRVEHRHELLGEADDHVAALILAICSFALHNPCGAFGPVRSGRSLAVAVLELGDELLE